MSTVTLKTELTENGYKRIDAKIQTIENLASTGINALESRTSRFYTIMSETKRLRQIILEELMIVPASGNESKSTGDAA